MYNYVYNFNDKNKKVSIRNIDKKKWLKKIKIIKNIWVKKK